MESPALLAQELQTPKKEALGQGASKEPGPVAPVQKKQRIFLLDHLRAVALINMVAYHTCYDLAYLFGLSLPWFQSLGAHLWQQFICWTFILVSGATFCYDSRPFSRGIFVFTCAMMVSLGTVLAAPQHIIYFGVLHFLGCAILLTGLCCPWLAKVPGWLGALVCWLLFFLTMDVPDGAVSFWGVELFSLPESWYQTKLLYPFGLPHASLSASDYFPLLPWLFLYWAGFFCWRCWRGRLCQIAWLQRPLPGLVQIGQHSLLIYAAHQPVIFAILSVLRYTGLL